MCSAATHALIGGLGSDASRRSPIETRDEPADIIGRVIISALLLAPGVTLTQTCAPCKKKDKNSVFHFGVIYAKDSEFDIGHFIRKTI